MTQALFFIPLFKVLIIGIFIWAIVYAILKKINIFGDGAEPINSLVSLLAAIIVSFSGVVTYAVSYSVSWFAIILFLVFSFLLLLMFLGVSFEKITEVTTKKEVIIGISIAFLLLFSIIFVKSFFALNNAHDTTSPPNSPYNVSTQANIGYDDVTGSSFTFPSFGIDPEVSSVAFFLIALGIIVMLIR